MLLTMKPKEVWMMAIDKLRDRVILYFGDALTELDNIPNESVDLIVTDPPYMISRKDKITRNVMGMGAYRRSMDISLDFGQWDHFESLEEYIQFTKVWVSKAFSKLKDGGWMCIFFDMMKIYILEDISQEIGITPKTIFVWAKTNAPPHFRSMNFVSATEFIWCGEKGNMKMKNFRSQPEMYNYMLYPNKTGFGESDHPTEKPVALLKRLIMPTTVEDDVVLDPFMGSGSTGVASMLLNRKFIGIEKDQHFYEQGKSRIEKHIGLSKLDIYDYCSQE